MHLLKTATISATIIATISTSCLAATIMPGQTQPAHAAADISTLTLTADTASVSQTYTGVVVDARGHKLETTFSPVIYDETGRIIYGAENIDPIIAISQGMVEYAAGPESAITNSRAGANPLVVKAVAIKGGGNSTNPVNVVVTVKDGDKILKADRAGGMLRRCAVVFMR